MPADRRLIKPARSISLWLTTSASAGASLSVAMKKELAFMGVVELALTPSGTDCTAGAHAGNPGIARRTLRVQ
jgi:hypothetical protein